MLRLTFLSEVRYWFRIVSLCFFLVISRVWVLSFVKGHSLWHLVPFLKAEVYTWIVCPHSWPLALQICLNVLTAPPLSSFSHFLRPRFLPFRYAEAQGWRAWGLGYQKDLEIIEGPNKFELNFYTRTGNPHTLKEEIRKKRPLGSASVVVRAVDSLKGFFIKPLGNGSSREGGLLYIKISNSANAVVQCSVVLLCSFF